MGLVDEIVIYLSTLMSAVAFVTFFFGIFVYRHITWLRRFYVVMFLGYCGLYGVDMLVLAFPDMRRFWYPESRQLGARALIAYTHLSTMLFCVLEAANGHRGRWAAFMTYLSPPRSQPAEVSDERREQGS
jgi:hypothetical protein